MRVSLEQEPAEFTKQVADLRRFLNAQEQRGGSAALSGRLMTARRLCRISRRFVPSCAINSTSTM